jgi:hypothetical protein
MPAVAPASALVANAARSAIIEALQTTPCPANWRFRLSTDNATERLIIEVQNRELIEIRIFGRRIFKYYSSWTSVRVLSAKTYEQLLQRLIAEPEFLETEVVVGGFLEPAYT